MNFDLDKYVKHSAKLQMDDIDFEAFRSHPLDEDSLRCLRYMHDVEFHTVCYLRDLLVTRAHNDPRVTTFLTFWTYEEYWHGEAIARVLAMHDEMSGAERVAETRALQGKWDKVKPLISMLGSALVKDFPAVHMAWGAINEWTTQSGYARLIAKAENPALTELLKRIMKQEGRHVDFYASQASERLSGRKRAQFATRQLLLRKWAPVGSGVMPERETRFITKHLFGDEEGLSVCARIDRNIDRLPGLEGLGLMSRTIVRYV